MKLEPASGAGLLCAFVISCLTFAVLSTGVASQAAVRGARMAHLAQLTRDTSIVHQVCLPTPRHQALQPTDSLICMHILECYQRTSADCRQSHHRSQSKHNFRNGSVGCSSLRPARSDHPILSETGRKYTGLLLGQQLLPLREGPIQERASELAVSALLPAGSLKMPLRGLRSAHCRPLKG